MNDIDFKPQDVERFRMEIRRLGKAIMEVQGQIKADAARVAQYWRDESLERAKKDIDQAKAKMTAALTQIDGQIGRALERQLEWARRYGKIR